jgi:hypothetical protein
VLVEFKNLPARRQIFNKNYGNEHGATQADMRDLPMKKQNQARLNPLAAALTGACPIPAPHGAALEAVIITAQMSFGQLSAALGYTWQDNIYSSSSITSSRYIIDDHTLLNARLTLSNVHALDGNMRVALRGRNLRDTEYYSSRSQFGNDINGATFGAPRSYGVDFVYAY